ncbi:class I SAM-dependent methyltransferase [Mesorhizobium sp. INR15]|uniref:class I SAM-dependent methyltransferase n=1 Tax=Mesorhizobium sp. INR15 TaxID=2654248 RepID=UPI0018966116|nr:class I SAM-dependent methyltransferase [Mesorhizobium sp. INR15]QPC92079.1 methyltransferase domain-containing protein [Mesorhizobium sp. INR15]
MSNVTEHYGSNGIVERILAAIPEAAPGALAARHLYPFDQLHGRELIATQEHAARLAPTPDNRILDIGSGIGGPARFLAATYGCQVEGIDLTPAFVEASSQLTALCGLHGKVHFRHANAADIPFADNSFDAAICFYVGMNIEAKAPVIKQALRVLKPMGKLIWTEAVLASGEPYYPLPWAVSPATSHLVERQTLKELFETTGFVVDEIIDETSEHVELAVKRANAGIVPSPAQLQANEIVLGAEFVQRRKNYIRSLSEGRLASVAVIASKAG